MPEDPRAVIAACDARLERAPDDAGLWYQKGCALKALGHTADALHCIAEAAKIAPAEWGPHLDIIFAFGDRGIPKYAEVWINRAIVFENLQRLDEAESTKTASLTASGGGYRAISGPVSLPQQADNSDFGILCEIPVNEAAAFTGGKWAMRREDGRSQAW